MKEKVSKKFQEIYGSGAILFASPGRINLIGEHTDYNGGFVFPGAVDKGIVAAIKLNGTDKVRAYALEKLEFGRDYLIPKPFDPRLLCTVAPAVARAAIESGVARQPIADWDAYTEKLRNQYQSE